VALGWADTGLGGRGGDGLLRCCSACQVSFPPFSFSNFCFLFLFLFTGFNLI
jgi:hypothetical protein